MTDQTVTSARDAIADAVYDGRDGDFTEECYAATDRIIAIVREVMMRDDVVTELRFVDDMRDGMAAALDAAFGE